MVWFFSNRRVGEKHPRAKLSRKQVEQIRELYSKGFTKKVIAQNFKVSIWNVDQIVKRKTWKHL